MCLCSDFQIITCYLTFCFSFVWIHVLWFLILRDEWPRFFSIFHLWLILANLYPIITYSPKINVVGSFIKLVYIPSQDKQMIQSL